MLDAEHVHHRRGEHGEHASEGEIVQENADEVDWLRPDGPVADERVEELDGHEHAEKHFEAGSVLYGTQR